MSHTLTHFETLEEGSSYRIWSCRRSLVESNHQFRHSVRSDLDLEIDRSPGYCTPYLCIDDAVFRDPFSLGEEGSAQILGLALSQTLGDPFV